ncbi:hypothetical protein GBAR_LOCUS16142 [Geodia barretti]|uniref:Uncharacterized protein n=1 Tax=Geodia barretti TaxID=519541 RepID=A0AA35WVN0_GEOBA|nr:hypothetical protein GBAR_LOCUS16142 [Geodia barretti]
MVPSGTYQFPPEVVLPDGGGRLRYTPGKRKAQEYKPSAQHCSCNSLGIRTEG